MSNISLQIDHHWAQITFNRPEALNALDVPTLESLHTVLRELVVQPDLAVIVLSGGDNKAFIAGADIKAMQNMSPQEASAFSHLGHSVMFELERAPQITLATVNGFALGGGCEMAMACDLVYASDKAKFGQPEVNLGIVPGFGGTQRLVRYVGAMKARDLLLTGRMIDAWEAERIGLVSQVFAADEFQAKINEVVSLLLEKGPDAIRRTKALVRYGQSMDLESACALERENFAMCFASTEHQEGMSAFIEKRKPAFR